jgi:hypothetical protein
MNECECLVQTVRIENEKYLQSHELMGVLIFSDGS